MTATIEVSPEPLAAELHRAPNTARVRQLDVVRAVAIGLVLLHHSGISPKLAGPSAPLLQRVEAIGWIGVDLFFVLSGFLIGGLLFAEINRTGRLDAKRFLIRRAFKIWPQYFSYLLFFLVIGVACFGNTLANRLEMMLFAFVHLQNYVNRWQSHIWSLAVEEHFYLALPLLLVILLARSRRVNRSGIGVPWMIPSIVAVLSGVLAIRLILLPVPYRANLHYFGTHARIDSLAAGVLLAYVSTFLPDLWSRLARYRVAIACAGIVMLSPVLLIWPYAAQTYPHSVGFTTNYVGFSCLLFAVLTIPVESKASRWLDGRVARALAWIGVNSYGIYLWHQDVVINPLQKFLFPKMDGLPASFCLAIQLLLVVGLSIAVGACSTRLIERPALALRERLFPSRTAKAS